MLYNMYEIKFHPHPDPTGIPNETECRIELSYWPTKQDLAAKVRAKAEEWQRKGIPDERIKDWIYESRKIESLPAPKPGAFTQEVRLLYGTLTAFNRQSTSPEAKDDLLGVSHPN